MRRDTWFSLVAAGAALSMFSFVGIVHAQDTYGSLEEGESAHVEIPGGTVDVSANGDVQVKVQNAAGGVTEVVKTSAGAATVKTTGAQGTVNVTQGTSGDVEVTTTTSDDEVGLVISADDVRDLTEGSITITSASSVRSSSDLKIYAQGVAKSNTAINKLSVTDDTVSVNLKRQGRFLWIFPVTLTDKASVIIGADGKATTQIQRPWWSFLVSSDVETDTFDSTLSESLSSVTVPVVTGSAVNVSVTVQADVLSKLDSAVKATYNVKANVK